MHVAFGVFVPAALQGNPTALDVMAEIASADDVRGYDVYARQVLEEAAKRGCDYAETLLKQNAAPADERQEAKPADNSGMGRATRGQPGDVPEIHCTTLDGKRLTSVDLKGRIVVVHFWSTTCASCVAAMPHVKEAHEKLANQGVFFLGVCGDQDRTAVDQYLDDHHITWPQTMDDTALCKTFGVNKYPAAFILDKSGTITWAVHPASLEKPLQQVLHDR